MFSVLLQVILRSVTVSQNAAIFQALLADDWLLPPGSDLDLECFSWGRVHQCGLGEGNFVAFLLLPSVRIKALLLQLHCLPPQNSNFSILR